MKGALTRYFFPSFFNLNRNGASITGIPDRKYKYSLKISVLARNISNHLPKNEIRKFNHIIFSLFEL